jgi:hypothetical protein
VDALGVSDGEPNAKICWEIDVPRWKGLLFSALRGSR